MSQQIRESTALLKALIEERPNFHGYMQGDTKPSEWSYSAVGTRSWAIQTRVLEWIEGHVRESARTLETGCGYSTVVLASLAKTHTCVSPFVEEHALIQQWCMAHGLSMDHVEFVAKPSQDVVPHLAYGELDFVLIDGDHAFPAPFIDWYYTAEHIRHGGYVVVDDTQIPTGTILRDFLAKESGRWSLAATIGRTAIFERVTRGSVAKGIVWRQQPYCEIPSQSLLSRAARRLLRMIE